MTEPIIGQSFEQRQKMAAEEIHRIMAKYHLELLPVIQMVDVQKDVQKDGDR